MHAGLLKLYQTRYSTYRRMTRSWNASPMLLPNCIASRRYQKMSLT